MRLSGKTITAAALLATAIGGVVAISPAFAQQADQAARVASPQTMMGHGSMRGGPGDMLHFVARSEALLEQFDTNEDGVVTQDEIDAVRAAELAEYDTDGEGTLSLEEYQAYWLSRLYERMVDAFQHLDADGDGEVTIDEFNAGLANIVERLDASGDGALGEDDRPERPAERMGPGGPNGPAHGPGSRF